MLHRFMLPVFMVFVACGPAVNQSDGGGEAEAEAGDVGDDPVDLPADLPPDVEERSPPESWAGGFYRWGFEEELEIGVDVEHGSVFEILEHLTFLEERQVEMSSEGCLSSGAEPRRFTLTLGGDDRWELVPRDPDNFFRGQEPLQEILLEEGDSCDELIVRFVGKSGWEEEVLMNRGGVCWAVRCEELPPPRGNNGLVRSRFEYCPNPPEACE